MEIYVFYQRKKLSVFLIQFNLFRIYWILLSIPGVLQKLFFEFFEFNSIGVEESKLDLVRIKNSE